MATFETTVTRVRHVHTVFTIEAETAEEAEQLAQELVSDGPVGTSWRWTSHTREGDLGHDEYETAELPVEPTL